MILAHLKLSGVINGGGYKMIEDYICNATQFTFGVSRKFVDATPWYVHLTLLVIAMMFIYLFYCGPGFNYGK